MIDGPDICNNSEEYVSFIRLLFKIGKENAAWQRDKIYIQ